jgi:prepilin-type N-terminal cleavage/methylation domain-containing protein
MRQGRDDTRRCGRSGRAGRPRGADGYGLVELLVAVAIAGVVLTAGWAWCWSLSASCAASCSGCDAASSVAFARRLTTAELGECLGLVAVSSCRCSTTSIAFVVPAGGGDATELVTYVYDPVRGVLWRKSASAHLAEGVDDFAISYVDGEGHVLACDAGGGLPAAALPLVRRVDLSATVRCAGRSAQASWQVALRSPT